MLDLGADETSRLLENLFVGPVSVEVSQGGGDAVVLANEKLVYGSDSHVFVHSHVTGLEAPGSNRVSYTCFEL